MRKKRNKINLHRNQTGGGPPTNLKLSNLEELVVDFCGAEAMNGNIQLNEIGLNCDSRSVSSAYFLASKQICVNMNIYTFLFSFKGHSNFDSDSLSMDNSFASTPMSDKENTSTQDESDLLFCTPQKSTPKSSSKRVLLPSARTNSFQSQIDRAYSVQQETNQLLRESIRQNNEIIEQNSKILLALNRIANSVTKIK